MLKKVILVLIVLPIISIAGYTQLIKTDHPHKKRFITEDFAKDIVMGLPEIKDDDAYIRRTTKGERHLSPMIYGDPDSVHLYYWVVVGEDNGISFVTHFTFYVYTNGRKILYHDNFSDSTIDLNTWRRKYHTKLYVHR